MSDADWLKGPNVVEVNIQWKGTDVCLDFHCPCQPIERTFEGHYDGYFADRLRCPHCGVVYQLAHTVAVTVAEDQDDERARVPADDGD